MASVLVVAHSARSAGGRSVVANYLSTLRERGPAAPGDFYIVLTPLRGSFDKHSCAWIQITSLGRLLSHGALSPILSAIVIPAMMYWHRIDRVINFSDVPIRSWVPQIYMFDWAYAVYPESIAWKRMTAFGFLWRRIKLHFLKRWIKCPAVVVAQTSTARVRLEKLLLPRTVAVVPNAVSVEHFHQSVDKRFALPSASIKLLCLTRYYTHKNIEILVPVAEQLRARGLPCCIVLTLDERQEQRAIQLFREIRRRGLAREIVNVGPVDPIHIPALYKQVDCLIMPTLLESYSGTYVEAMHCGIPILTSDMDFARDVCGDAAKYFDPLDVAEICGVVEQFVRDKELRKRLSEAGINRAGTLPTWRTVVDDICAIELRLN